YVSFEMEPIPVLSASPSHRGNVPERIMRSDMFRELSAVGRGVGLGNFYRLPDRFSNRVMNTKANPVFQSGFQGNACQVKRKFTGVKSLNINVPLENLMLFYQMETLISNQKSICFDNCFFFFY